jgi:hypothetical protein
MTYKEALDNTVAKISELLKERERIDSEISLLKTVAQAYGALLSDGSIETRLVDLINEVPSEPGITNAIRRVLSNSKIPLSALEIKSGLENLGVDLSSYVNSGAVIHNTLTRLEKQGEVLRVENPTKQTVAYAIVSKNSLLNRLRGI